MKNSNFKTRPEVGVLRGVEVVEPIQRGDLFRVTDVFDQKVELIQVDLACLSSAERKKLLEMEERDARIDEEKLTEPARNPGDKFDFVRRET